jgi:hydroxymethylbilane synthase
MRQAKAVAERLLAANIQCELVTYVTTGDRNLAKPLAEIGAKGLFTEELEHDLARGAVDCCVHSLKDLPTEMPDGLSIAAVLAREDPRDVLVVNGRLGKVGVADLPAGSRVGTSSLRRRAQLLAVRGDLDIVELRGNVPTRVRKVDDGQVDAAILAAAGLHRLDLAGRISAYLDAPSWLPAAGQGAIAVQVRADDPRARAVIAPLNDQNTATSTTAERAFLAGLDGGCQVPMGSLAVLGSNPTLHGFIASIDGARELRGSIGLDLSNPERSGAELARSLRARGATEILDALRGVGGSPAPQPE